MAITQHIDQRDCTICWASQDGGDLTARVLRLAAHSLAFEYADPSQNLQLSQLLPEFRILNLGREIYRGRAMVCDLIPTAGGLVGQVELEDGWHALPELSPGALRKECQQFLADWQQHFHIDPEFKSTLLDLQAFLEQLRRWCEQIELQAAPSASGQPPLTGHQLSTIVSPLIEPHLRALFDRFEAVARCMDPERWLLHSGLGRRMLHPLLFSAPFVRRAYFKPLGHAGDYEMVNMMFRDPHEGNSLLARVINYYALQLPPIQAHRNRVQHLAALLTQESLRLRPSGRPLRYLSIGCGPAQEVRRFAQDTPLADSVEFTLVDFEAAAITDLRHALRSLPTASGRPLKLHLKQQSIAQFLRTLYQGDAPAANQPRYDFICCAGLFDYLPDPVCQLALQAFHASLAPGGCLVVTNVDEHPSRHQMELILDWHVLLRDRAALAALLPREVPPETVRFCSEPTGVNLFMEVRKPE